MWRGFRGLTRRVWWLSSLNRRVSSSPLSIPSQLRYRAMKPLCTPSRTSSHLQGATYHSHTIGLRFEEVPNAAQRSRSRGFRPGRFDELMTEVACFQRTNIAREILRAYPISPRLSKPSSGELRWLYLYLHQLTSFFSLDQVVLTGLAWSLQPRMTLTAAEHHCASW